MVKHLSIFLLTLIGLPPANPLMAQERSVEMPAMRLTIVPMSSLTGGVVYIKASVNDHPDSLNFILDTGSGGISLDSSTCVELGITLQPSDKTIRGIAGIRRVKFLYGAKLHMPGLTIDSLDFHVNDYDILTSVYGIKVDGIIGYSFFKRYIVGLDYDSMHMEVYTKGAFKYPKRGHLLRPLLTSIPIQTLHFNDARDMTSRFYFDTGAGLAFLLSEEFVRDSALLRRKRKEPLVTQAEGVGGKMTMRLTTVKGLRVGPYKFRNVPTFLFEDQFNVTSYPFLGGLIGNEILRRFNTILNYDKREIHITPNNSLKEPFDYAYTGLGIYFVNGRCVVEDVVEDSPGEKAGFKSGDIIIGINSNLSNNITTYKSIMQHAVGKLRFLVSRDGEIILIYMKPSSILR